METVFGSEGIPVLGFAAYSGTGKTTLLEKVICCLKKRGLRVGVLKHDAHGIDVDREGKDSWRFSRAGADISMVSGPGKAAFTEQRDLDLAGALSLMHDVDLVLIEGFKNESFTQIGLSRESCGKGFTRPVDEFAAIATDQKEIETSVPVFSLEDPDGIAEFIMQNMNDFTHFNAQGRAKMVDVGDKPESRRSATAAARVLVSRETWDLIASGGMKKGDVLTVAQIAGVMGAKRTPDIIPMCHPIQLHGIDLSLHLDEARLSVEIEATVSCDGKTGVEMEALTAASIAALTVYDMCKAVQKDMEITDIRLLEKSGGVHGDFRREETDL